MKSVWAVVLGLGFTALVASAQTQSTGNSFAVPEKYNFSRYYPNIVVKLPERVSPKADYALPVKLEALTNAKVLKSTPNGASVPLFNARQRETLLKNGFVVQPERWLEFFQLYESNRYSDIPVFVTLDAALHAYHLAFDKILRDLERQRLAPTLASLTKSLVKAAEAQLSEAKGSRLIDPKFVVPAEVRDVVTRELALITQAKDRTESPVMSLITPPGGLEYSEDYSQYRPRGHYTKGALLGQYFRAMMWLGRINFRLVVPGETRTALLVTKLLRANPKFLEQWASLYYPTTFFVGTSDDLGVEEYAPESSAAYGSDFGVAALSDDLKLSAFTKRIEGLSKPKINSMIIYDTQDKEAVTQGFRFMGQRFVLDGFVFGQMTYRKVGTREKPRDLPSALDFFAALNNPTASAILTKETNAPTFQDFTPQLEKTRATMKNLGADIWKQNLYSGWLYALRAVAFPGDARNPQYMRTPAWSRKSLQSALGSYAELKHDTILYAKQTMVELGGGPEEVLPRGYVEADPVSWSRLLALTRMTKAGLKAAQISTESTSAMLDSLESMISFLQRIAEAQLNGTTISQDDYERIKFFGGWLEEITLKSTDSADGGSGNDFGSDPVQAAIIADIATGFKNVLEVGIGRVHEMLVVVPNGKGKLQVARGGVFSYYEFPHPSGDRLTNEKWRGMLDKKTNPAQPAWTNAFTVK
jgi:Protein of unknown function (DUF3160)